MKLIFVIATVTCFLCLSSCGSKSSTAETGSKDSLTEANGTKEKQEAQINDNGIPTGKVDKINTATFIERIFDFKKEKDWNYKGNTFAIVDFYATWCGPCKRVAPVMEELAKEYKADIQFYKVDTDSEPEIAQAFGIQSIPSILFIPKSGKPSMYVGAYEKSEYVRIINELFYNKK